ncbi:MAG: FAD-dependent monooxygenase [Candidatus Dormibacteraceae bacterium]
MKEKDILISGAGIAGPALAFWLCRAGHRVTIVERASEPRRGGQAVDLRGAGRTVIERMGRLQRAREVAIDQRGFALVDRRGRITARMPVDAFDGRGIVSEIEILRGDLGGLLYEASLPGTEYVFGDTIAALEAQADGVEVTFEHAPSRRFDLVVGADGLHSTVRRLVFGPDESCIEDLGLLSGGWTGPANVDLDGWFLMYNAPGGLVAAARPGRLPGEIKVGLSFRSGPLAVECRGEGALKEKLATRFAGAGWETSRLLEGMWDASDFYFDTTGQVRLDRWSRGRVVLLGDAGYCPTPLTGLGTSLALVGAYVLAGELSSAGEDHEVAFARYEERLRPYVKQAQELPPGGVGSFAPRSALMIRMRALSMRWMTRWPMRNLLAGQFTKADAIDLPDYAEVLGAVQEGAA